MKYHILSDDKRVRGRWYLKAPVRANNEPIDPRIFTAGESLDTDGLHDLRIPLRRVGRPLDFTLADFDMPVMRDRLATELQGRCGGEVQLIRAAVEGTSGEYRIVNVTQTVDCLDAENSGVTRWSDAHGRPEKVGQYMIVAHPRIDARRVGTQQIFRIRGWENVVVVSDAISNLFAEALGAQLHRAESTSD